MNKKDLLKKVANANEINKELKDEIILSKGKKHKIFYAKTFKSKVKAETKTSILLVVANDVLVWFSKKFVNPSMYSNILTLSIIAEYDYDAIKNGDEGTIKGSNLIEFLDAKESKKDNE